MEELSHTIKWHGNTKYAQSYFAIEGYKPTIMSIKEFTDKLPQRIRDNIKLSKNKYDPPNVQLDTNAVADTELLYMLFKNDILLQSVLHRLGYTKYSEERQYDNSRSDTIRMSYYTKNDGSMILM